MFSRFTFGVAKTRKVLLLKGIPNGFMRSQFRMHEHVYDCARCLLRICGLLLRTAINHDYLSIPSLPSASERRLADELACIFRTANNILSTFHKRAQKAPDTHTNEKKTTLHIASHLSLRVEIAYSCVARSQIILSPTRRTRVPARVSPRCSLIRNVCAGLSFMRIRILHYCICSVIMMS